MRYRVANEIECPNIAMVHSGRLKLTRSFKSDPDGSSQAVFPVLRDSARRQVFGKLASILIMLGRIDDVNAALLAAQRVCSRSMASCGK